MEGLQITSASEMKKEENFCQLLYAEPGGGKTSTMQYLEGKTLLLDIDHTSRVLAGKENIDIAKIDTDNPEASIKEFYVYAKKNIANYENIVIDNLSHYQKLWLMEKAKNTKSGQPELKDYGIFDNHLIGIVEAFKVLGVNVIFTAWETTRQITLESGQLYNQFLPDIREKVVNHIMGIIPIVGRLVRNPQTKVRGFILSKSDGTFAKNQLDNREFCLQNEIFTIGDVVPSTEEENK